MDTDRNLLFGVLALQADAISSSQFIDACVLWTRHKDQPLADVLLERGWITPEDRADVDRLVARKLKKHGGDVAAGLAEATTDPVLQSLAVIDDPEVRRTLDGVTPSQESPAGATTAHLPQRESHYALARLHATGGIGQVWFAHDSSLDRDVALKELRPERAHHPVLRARFLKEARITGQLEHPGIVPIYELGQRAGGEPFYTMRFVRGRTLTRAIRDYHARRQGGEARPLEFRELLTAFVGVCNALAYAHSRGVLHRDVKPANVVLGDFGEVVVLDWGLARLIDRPEDDPAVPIFLKEADEHTQAGQVLGTPAYLSPEQADGRLDLLDARSDVYGLGAILYEVLTGGPPFAGEDTQAILQQVRHEPPAPPRIVVPATPAALEAVCLKALAKDRAARYGSARELAGEVQHFLADEPVSAYREPAPVRLARWGRRHRSLVTGAAALLLTAVAALSVGAGLLGRANARVEREREAAQEQRDLAVANFRKARQAVDDYFTQVSEDRLLRSPLPGLQPLRKELLETALKYYREFAAQHHDDPALRADLAQALHRVGQITTEIGSQQDAVAAFQEARVLWQGLLEGDPERVEYRRGLARACRELGRVQSRQLGRITEGIQVLKEAEVLFERLAQEAPDDRDSAADLARTCDWLAGCHGEKHQSAEELRCEEKSLRLWQRLAAADRKYELQVASALMNLGYYYTRRGNATEGLRHHEQARAILQKQIGENPADHLVRSELRRVCTNIGFLHSRLTQRLDEAQRYFEQALAYSEHLARENPSVVNYQQIRADCAIQLAKVLTRVNQLRAAEKLVLEAIALVEPLHARDPGNVQNLVGLADAHLALGRLQSRSARLPQGQVSLTKARDLFQKLVEKAPANREYGIWLGIACSDLGDLHRQWNQPEEAAQSYRQAITVLEPIVREKGTPMGNLFTISEVYFDLAVVHREAGRRAEALVFFRKSFDVRKEVSVANPTHRQAAARLADACLPLADLLREDGKPAEARQALETGLQALGRQTNLQARDHLRLARLHALLATLPADEKKEQAALKQAMAELMTCFVQRGQLRSAELQGDPYLKSLTRRSDFQRLVAILQKREKARQQEQQQFARAGALLAEGKHAQALEAVQPALDSPQATALTWYNAARVCASASALARKDASLSAAEQESLAGRYADRAVRLLRQAVAKGFRGQANLDHMKADKDLDPLRDRADFRKLQGGLEKEGAARRPPD